VAQLNFTEEDWTRVTRDTLAWWEGELDRPLVYFSVTDPTPTGSVPRFGYQSNFPAGFTAEQIVDVYEPAIAATHFYGDAFPWFWVNYGPGIAAGFLGAQVNSVVEPQETVWFTPQQPLPIDQIRLQEDPENGWLARVKDLTRALVERYQGNLQVGHTDLGGNLDILASFRTTGDLLLDLSDHPQEVSRLVQEITRLWIGYYDTLDAIIRPACRGTSSWAPIWSPGKTYMLQCDFSYMISPKMFERFVLPDLAACCDHLDHAFYHLDGKGEIPHLKHLLAIERLRGIQWIPGDGQPAPEEWPDLLKRIRDGGKRCQVFVTPEGARRIVRELGGKGFLLVIQNYGPEFQNPDVVHAFFEDLRQEDISLTRTLFPGRF
jgi:5-methyltetrahydrofolate--homocysteine methyltransferase